LPDARGFFGKYGGAFVPEVLAGNILELQSAFTELLHDQNFWQEYVHELRDFSGRPTPLTFASRLSEAVGGARIYLKREDLNQTGAHKVNNVIGQGLLARRLGKTRVIAETGAGQHGVATATMAARFGLKATIYMGAEDVARQRPNVFWMERLGAEVVPVTSGTQTLKDAINEALRDWSSNIESTHYLLGTACGPHPFPALVAYLQSVIGIEAAAQCRAIGIKPKRVYACLGGGSNALGIFQGFLGAAECIGVEAGGKGIASGVHAARIDGGKGTIGIAQGYTTLFLQDEDGQMLDTHSVAAGLDYIGVSPIVADLCEKKLVRAASATDDEVIAALKKLMATEGIIAALESSHGLAGALREAKTMAPSEAIIVNVSGRGDKDIFTIAGAFADKSWQEFLRAKAAEKKERT
jgi:tryptophan synthase beta chain